MKNKGKLVCCAVIAAVIINIVLPKLVAPLATKEEAMPPHGAKHLSLKGQVMHMLVHHDQVPLTSSVVVAVIVGLSVCVASNCVKR